MTAGFFLRPWPEEVNQCLFRIMWPDFFWVEASVKNPSCGRFEYLFMEILLSDALNEIKFHYTLMLQTIDSAVPIIQPKTALPHIFTPARGNF